MIYPVSKVFTVLQKCESRCILDFALSIPQIVHNIVQSTWLLI